MRNKFNGLSIDERTKLKMISTIPLSQAVALLNTPTLTRFEQEVIVRSIKENVCQYIYAHEHGRVFLNVGVVHNFKMVIDMATRAFGFNIYSEYVQEVEAFNSRVGTQQKRVAYTTPSGTQLLQEQLGY